MRYLFVFRFLEPRMTRMDTKKCLTAGADKLSKAFVVDD